MSMSIFVYHFTGHYFVVRVNNQKTMIQPPVWPTNASHRLPRVPQRKTPHLITGRCSISLLLGQRVVLFVVWEVAVHPHVQHHELVSPC
ncbi:hypothetical protein P171DRAFT_50826 [Karstenula rhodostoma CBS 690.94]|uniref:Uncharacterized protein n=1 Tax=Karstenula rhodostoma CBS 690.94 TaxID=1392251 RepID=A0A9P4PH27_9PLEO|nr:hypothetical protein P171DRAFT_50826 [Karstenula rhodostoma CBS 690.94]